MILTEVFLEMPSIAIRIFIAKNHFDFRYNLAMKQVILASASPRRRELLSKVVKNFRVSPSRVDEARIKAGSPKEFAAKAALAKALEIAKRTKNAIVIGADTIVVLKKKILGKPRTKKEAVKMLKRLAGRTHQVITGLALIDTARKKMIIGTETTKVRMKKVAVGDIMDYVKSGRPMDKAGSYGIQEIEEIFIDKVIGDYENVVGLPVRLAKELLKKLRGKK